MSLPIRRSLEALRLERSGLRLYRCKKMVMPVLHGLFALSLTSCVDNQNKNQAIDNYINREVNERIKMIGQI